MKLRIEGHLPVAGKGEMTEYRFFVREECTYNVSAEGETPQEAAHAAGFKFGQSPNDFFSDVRERTTDLCLGQDGYKAIIEADAEAEQCMEDAFEAGIKESHNHSKPDAEATLNRLRAILSLDDPDEQWTPDTIEQVADEVRKYFRGSLAAAWRNPPPMKVFINAHRKDGKYNVTYVFPLSDKRINKVVTGQKLADDRLNGYIVVGNFKEASNG